MRMDQSQAIFLQNAFFSCKQDATVLEFLHVAKLFKISFQFKENVILIIIELQRILIKMFYSTQNNCSLCNHNYFFIDILPKM